MNITPFLPDLFKYSPAVFLVSVILYSVWSYFKYKEKVVADQIDKKDAAILTLMTDHSEKLLVIQKEAIVSQGVMASSNVQLSNSLDRLSDTILQNQTTLLGELSEIKAGSKVRPLNGTRKPVTPTEVIAKA